jgi:hypothetical protein
MKTNFRLAGAAAPFAHLLGLSRRGEKSAAHLAKRAEGEDDEDEKKKDARRAEKDDERCEDDERDDDKEAEEKEKDEGETDDGEEVEDDDKKTKRSKKAKGKRAEDDDKDKDKDADVDGEDDDPDEEMRGRSPLAKARRRERARCKAIFSTAAAAERPDVAASIAFDTALTRTEAVALLTATAAGQAVRPPRLADRMADLKVAHVGPEADAKAPAHLTPTAAAIIAAGERARGR